MPSRAGAVAIVRNIPRRKEQKSKKNQKAIEDDSNDPKKGKLNIFEQHDSQMLKREVLTKMGYGSDNDKMALVPLRGGQLANVDSKSQASYASSMATLDSIEEEKKKRKAIDYLKKGQEGKESVKDYIDLSRQILRA